MYSYSLLALAASLASVSATVYQGFNYGPTFTDESVKQESDFEAEFNTAKHLAGTNGAFTSARLYTMIQGGTTNTPTGAIQAAINTQTSLLLGLWASGGQTGLDNELAALQSAMGQYGSKFTDLIAAISVGSEDLYRNSPTGIKNNSTIGADPDTIVNFIDQTRKAIAGTGADGVPVGHVDTWTAWVNGSNAAVAEACDFVGMDAYPYFQTTEANSIQDGHQAFFSAYDATQGASAGKPVWITETGWPVSGKTANLAVPSIQNAKIYWDQVGCQVLGSINTYWFTLQDADPTTPSPSFGLVGSTLTTTPLYDLTCPKKAAVKPSHSKPSHTKAAHSKPASSSSPHHVNGGGAIHHGSSVHSSKVPTSYGASTPTPTPVLTPSTKPSTKTPKNHGTAAPYPTPNKPAPSSSPVQSSSGGDAAPAGSSAGAGVATTTMTGGAVAPTAKMAGFGIGVVAIGAALVL